MRKSALVCLPLMGLLGCTQPAGTGGSGGNSGSGGNGNGSGGANSGSGGANSGSGGASSGSGGASSGSGGQTGSGGASASGGSTASGGATATGGSATGGASPGSGGMTTGSGGTATGGKGGTTTTGSGGGTAMGGANGTCSPPTCGPSVTDFFDNGKLATINITIDAADLGGAAANTWLDVLWTKHNHCRPFDKSDLVRVTFQYQSPDGKGNITIPDVGMRLRGGMGKGYNKLAGFKLDFQKWLGTATGTARRRFADINRLNALSIEVQDDSHMLQCLSYKMMRDFGQPAPYCNHLKVYVNGTYYGLMENIEEPETGRFQAHHFNGDITGDTYQGSPSQSDCAGSDKFSDSQAKLLYSGATFSSYTSQYKITRGSTATAEAHLLPMLKCGDATQTADDATFKTCISEWLDVKEWLRQIAAESLMPTMESFMVQRNFLLYFVPDAAAPHGGRFQVSSWDLDVSLDKASCYPSSCDPFTATAAYYGPAGTRAKLATRLTTVFKTDYCQAMKDFLTNVYKPATVDAMATVIMPGLPDPVTTMAAWQSRVSAIKSFVTSHGASAMTTVNSACQ